MRKNKCPECGYEPTVFDGIDYHCPRCGWWGEIIELRSVVRDEDD